MNLALVLAAAWGAAAALLGVFLGRCIRLADDLDQPPPKPTVDAEFRALVPGMVTEDVFELDNEINRKARGAL